VCRVLRIGGDGSRCRFAQLKLITHLLEARSKRFNLLLLLRDRTPTPTCTKLGHDWPKNEPSRPYNGTRQFDAPQEQLSISVKKMLSKRFLFNDRCRGHFYSHMVFSRLGMFPDYKPYFGAHSV